MTTHALELPGPAHALRTLCGSGLTDFPEDEEHSLASDPEKISCPTCRAVMPSRLGSYIEPKGMSPNVTGFEVDETGASFQFEDSHLIGHIGDAFLRMLEESPGANYISWTLSDGKGRGVVLTAIKAEGKSPAVLRTEAQRFLERWVESALQREHIPASDYDLLRESARWVEANHLPQQPEEKGVEVEPENGE